GQGDNASKRQDVTAPGTELRGDFDSNDLQVGVGVAINLLPKGGSWQLTPLARLKYVNYSQESFAESGSAAGFTTDKITKETVISKVGARLGYTAEAAHGTTLGFDGGVYWVHDYSAGAKSAKLRLTALTPDSFEAVGRGADADTAQFNLGVQATFSESLTLRLSGQQDVSNNRQETIGVVSVAVNF
ncbi:MAG: autotransporter outer membrane beta-barrel domain-containing protein, partial [Proteobacteria bacterium]|nr:autotransporter outer membrane beta-barrel domain-containing protein [Pseudomonadota bacterium]